MNFADALPALLDRLAAAAGEVALFSERELTEWPAAALARMKAEGLLVKGPPADTLTCPGCEEDCLMPVEFVTTSSGTLRAFVVCDQRDDVARVAIARDQLEQWTCSPERVADVLVRLLGIRRSSDDAAGRWEVGILKGAKGKAHVVLGIEHVLRLHLAGHILMLADVLELDEKGLSVDRQALLNCVDNPVAAADLASTGSGVQAASDEDACAVFRNMESLRPAEISIALVGDTSESGLAGNNMLEISARKVTRRIAVAEFGLVDRRTGALNQHAAVLVGFAHGERISRTKEAHAATMKRLRAEFRNRLGLESDPFTQHSHENGWRPLFSIVDLRGRADDRAKEKAERRTVSLDQMQEQGCQFASEKEDEAGEGASADEWMNESGHSWNP